MTTSSAASHLQSEKTEMRRDVTLFGGISVLAGIMIGSGIFYIGAIVLQRAGMSPGLSLLVWIIGGLVTLLSGICSVAFAAALNSIWTIDPIAQKVIAISTVLLLTLINIRGVGIGSRLGNVFMVLKMLPILLILFAGLLLGEESPDLFMYPGEMPSISTILSMIGFAVIATLWAYEGWTNLNNIAEEIKNPKRNIPLALILAIVGVALLYVLFNYAIFRVVPYGKIVEMVNSGNYYLGTEAANMLFGSAGLYIVGAAMILAIFSSLNGCVLAFPRMTYAMARDGAFFKPFAKLHPTYRTPVNAQLASAALAIVLILSRTLGELTSLVALCGMIFHGMTFFSVIVLRRKYPDLERPYRVWFYPIPILVICAVMIGLIINTIANDPITVVLGFIVPLLGLGIYEVMFRKQHDAQVAAQAKEDGE